MRQIALSVLAFLPALLGFEPRALPYQAPVGPTGVLVLDESAVFEGFTLFTPGTTSYLIDTRGRVAHQWVWERPGDTQLLPNGHLLRLEVLAPGERTAPVNWGGASGLVSEYDWHGRLLWSTRIDGQDEIAHHMVHRMPNGNTLVIVWERISYANAVAAGRDPTTLNDPTSGIDCFRSTFPPGRYICDFWPDKIVELDPWGQPTGWRWRAWDHIDELPSPSRLDINYRFPLPTTSHRGTANFMHVNAVDFDPSGGTRGHVIINSRVFGEFFVIDYATGEIVDRWGNPCSYGEGACPGYMSNGDQELFGQHGAHVIRDPQDRGFGNVIVFDNGWMRPFNPTGGGTTSRVVEVDLRTRTIAWSYQTRANLHSQFVGYAQELPNGNRLITYGMEGLLLEVTRDAPRIVWSFVNPAVGDEARCILEDEDAFTNGFFRALRYAPDYADLDRRLRGRRLRFEQILGERGRCRNFWRLYERQDRDD